MQEVFVAIGEACGLLMDLSRVYRWEKPIIIKASEIRILLLLKKE